MEHSKLIQTIKKVSLNRLNENYKVTKKKKKLVRKNDQSDIILNPVIDSFSANR